jgi:hypothetical protein
MSTMPSAKRKPTPASFPLSATSPASKRASLSAAEGRKQTTVRLSPRVQAGLALVQQSLGGTINQHMNEGMSKYIDEKLSRVDQDLTESLGRIRRFRQKDPAFAKAFAQVAADEVAARGDDPVEGVVFQEDVGTTRRKVRRLIAGTAGRHA